MKAYTLEIRQEIRKEMRSGESEPPEAPFENRMIELEVFEKAKFLAMNEAEEQKNQVWLLILWTLSQFSLTHYKLIQEFYIWYQS